MTQTIIRATNTIGELLLLYGLVILVGAGGFALAEQKSFFDSVWWAIVTTTTTGYGDMFPVTLGGRVIAGLMMHVTLLLILPVMITRVIETLNPNPHQFTHEEQQQLLGDVEWIRNRLR